MSIENNKNLVSPSINLIRDNFKDFLIKAFYTINPATQFEDNWHIDLITQYLNEVEQQRIKRLLINIPPRYLKSTVISVAWPAWLLGHDPAKRIIVASYSMALSLKHSRDTRVIMSSDWYKENFPNTKISKGNDEKFKFITTAQGFRMATSVGGTLLGEGADILIADDPITPQQVVSKLRREKNSEWFSHTFATRLNNKKKGIMIVIMQRLHTGDLSDYLLKQKIWNHLSLPAVAEEDISYRCGEFKYERKKGELLHLAREGLEEIELAKLELGSYGFNAQYQQSPIAMDNSVIKSAWILRYDELPQTKGLYYQSWDCAVKPGHHCDYSVGTTWLVVERKIYLVDVFRRQLDFLDLKNMVVRLHTQYLPTAILIENKASGEVLIQEMQKTVLPIIGRTPLKDKFSRLLGVSSFFEAGKVYFPNNAFWLAELEDELFSFPNSRYDDQVDSITQFLEWLKAGALSDKKVGWV